ncbi:MAG: hypothetical protein AAF723_09395 [Pseudomonadota bacterium]
MASTSSIGLVCRCVSVVVGGYALTGGIVVLVSALLHGLGMNLADAVLLTMMLGFPLYVALVIWGFAMRDHWRSSLIFLGLASVSMPLAIIFTPSV